MPTPHETSPRAQVERTDRTLTQCPKCKYEIGVVGAARCPECGQPVTWRAGGAGWLHLPTPWCFSLVLSLLLSSIAMQYSLIQSHAYQVRQQREWNVLWKAKVTTDVFRKHALSWASAAAADPLMAVPPEISSDVLDWPSAAPTWSDALLVVFDSPRPTLFTGFMHVVVCAGTLATFVWGRRKPVSQAYQRACRRLILLSCVATAVQAAFVIIEVIFIWR